MRSRRQSGPAPVAVVTGASAGVGRAVARAFGARGYAVGLVARGEAGLDGARQDVVDAGGQALAIPADVADPEQVEAAARRAEEELGPIDIWVNDAFTSIFAPFVDIEPDEFRRATEVTYLGTVNGTRAALRTMIPRDRGTIVQVGSALAYRGIPLQSAYCGAKHAIQGFTEAVRCELRHDGHAIALTMVQLPAMNTPQFTWVRSRLPKRPQPVPPIYQPAVAGRAVARIAERPRRREYWIGGSTVATLAANAVVPGLLDRYLARTGYGSQQTDQPRQSEPRSNLWSPADANDDFGARGDFDEQAASTSPQEWASTHHGAVAAAGAGVAAAAAVAAVRGRRR